MRKVFREGAWRLLNEDGSVGEKCPPPCEEERRATENEESRRKFQAQADATGQEVWWRGERFVPAGGGVPVPPQEVRKPGTYEYKIVTQRDEFFAGKFEPLKLEVLINQLAADGWRVVSMTATDVSSFWGSFWSKGGGATRQELVILFERTVGGRRVGT